VFVIWAWIHDFPVSCIREFAFSFGAMGCVDMPTALIYVCEDYTSGFTNSRNLSQLLPLPKSVPVVPNDTGGRWIETSSVIPDLRFMIYNQHNQRRII